MSIYCVLLYVCHNIFYEYDFDKYFYSSAVLRP